MMFNDIVYVILHYMVMDDTIETVDSIINMNKNNTFKIVIVDNSSPNGTGEQLKELYKDSEDIIVILNDENLGFARGNNVGFRYAIRNLNPRYVILMNNDVLLTQDNMYELIEKEFESSEFAVLGPLVKTADGREDSSPVKYAYITKKALLKNFYKEISLFCIEFLYLTPCYKFFLSLLRKNKKEQTKPYDNYSRIEDVVLHGCFWIFSHKFWDVFDGLNEATFLYHEEELLYILAKSKSLKMVYNPNIVVFHKEDAASNAILSSGHKKNLFKLKHCISSSKALLRIYKELR